MGVLGVRHAAIPRAGPQCSPLFDTPTNDHPVRLRTNDVGLIRCVGGARFRGQLRHCILQKRLGGLSVIAEFLVNA